MQDWAHCERRPALPTRSGLPVFPPSLTVNTPSQIGSMADEEGMGIPAGTPRMPAIWKASTQTQRTHATPPDQPREQSWLDGLIILLGVLDWKGTT